MTQEQKIDSLRLMVTTAAGVCQDADLLDLVFKLLASENASQT